MRVTIPYGSEVLDLEIDERNLIASERSMPAPNLRDPAQAMRDALEHPLDYPPLRLALTPEDHVAIAIDESVPHLDELLVPLLQHIVQANVRPDAITLICTPPSSGQPWLDALPEELEEVHVEIHQPGERKKLAYLATTREGRRIYLNRTAVDADLLVILSRRGYDPRVGYLGAETALYPDLSDEATGEEVVTQFKSRSPDRGAWPIRQQAREVAWLLGAPFFVQVIDGSDGGIANIVAGPLESSDAGARLLDARWRIAFSKPADVVIAGMGGTSATGDDLARAAFASMRVVKPGGSIVLLSSGAPVLGPSFEQFRRHDDPALALQVLLQEKPGDLAAGYMWATAADHARIYLWSGLASEVVEEIFAIPLDNPVQAQRLLTSDASVAVLPEAQRVLAVAR
jgi:nickel-dependent lactate racemase